MSKTNGCLPTNGWLPTNGCLPTNGGCLPTNGEQIVNEFPVCQTDFVNTRLMRQMNRLNYYVILTNGIIKTSVWQESEDSNRISEQPNKRHGRKTSSV